MLKKMPTVPWKTLLLELVVVFIGVFLAFEFNNFSENRKVKSEKEKVMTSLKKELDVIGLSFGNMGAYQKSKAQEWDSLLRNKQLGDFYDWRYIQPQYNYAVLEYALNTRDARIVSFELYEKLVKVYRELKKLEHAENLMTEWGGQYKILPLDVDTTSITYQNRAADNRFAFYKFTRFANDRANIMSDLPKSAREALELINSNFTSKLRFELEKEVLRILAGRMQLAEGDEAWQEMKRMASAHYAHISDSEWTAFRQELLAELEQQ